ncbi:MAG: UDP-N-acetylglucosamine 2-epimerase, partial [archaeon]|nr:UDP-N-acetylglucosamine 2-epimerase [archaeon]
RALKIIELISKKIKIIFVISDKTKEVLESEGLMNLITENKNIEIIPHQNYINFVHLMNSSEFCVTDGGTMQEETYFMNRPCLLLRSVTERTEGLGETAFLSGLEINKIKFFLENYKKFKRIKKINFKSPSSLIADKLYELKK